MDTLDRVQQRGGASRKGDISEHDEEDPANELSFGLLQSRVDFSLERGETDVHLCSEGREATVHLCSEGGEATVYVCFESGETRIDVPLQSGDTAVEDWNGDELRVVNRHVDGFSYCKGYVSFQVGLLYQQFDRSGVHERVLVQGAYGASVRALESPQKTANLGILTHFVLIINRQVSVQIGRRSAAKQRCLETPPHRDMSRLAHRRRD